MAAASIKGKKERLAGPRPLIATGQRPGEMAGFIEDRIAYGFHGGEVFVFESV